MHPDEPCSRAQKSSLPFKGRARVGMDGAIYGNGLIFAWTGMLGAVWLSTITRSYLYFLPFTH